MSLAVYKYDMQYSRIFVPVIRKILNFCFLILVEVKIDIEIMIYLFIFSYLNFHSFPLNTLLNLRFRVLSFEYIETQFFSPNCLEYSK